MIKNTKCQFNQILENEDCWLDFPSPLRRKELLFLFPAPCIQSSVKIIVSYLTHGEGEYYGFIMNILCHYSPFHLSLAGPTVKLKWIIWKQISQMSNSTLKIRFLCSSCSVALCCFILNGLIYFIGTNNLDIQHHTIFFSFSEDPLMFTNIN